MNKVFKKVWSQRHGAFVAVSETANGRGKASTGVVGTAAAKGVGAALVVGLSLAHVDSALAVTGNTLPTGGQVVAGSAAISTNANTLTVNQSTQRAAINWQSFSIGSGGTVNFVQPNASSVTLNRVVGNEQSVIAGALNANGQVFLLNSSGVLFTGTSSVNVGGIVASTLNQSDADFMAGRTSFERSGTAASVINLGNITTADGGYVALLGNQVSNQGVITARLGTAVLAAGDKISLNFNGNSLVGVTIDQGTLSALVENQQAIRADGGLVILTAKGLDSVMRTVVNNTGEIRAQTIQNKDGKIYLLGGMDNDRIEVGGTLDASAPNGGNGGFVETSAARVKVSDSARVTTVAPNGSNGTWLIDPNDFTVAASGGDMTGAAVSTALAGGNFTIQSSAGATSGAGDIYVADVVNWSANNLSLEALGNIYIKAVMTASGTSTLNLKAGYDSGTSTYVSTDKYVLTGFNANGSYAGRIDFTSASDPTGYRSGTNILTINGQSYTLINKLGAQGSTTGADLQGMNSNLSGNFAMAGNIDASATSGWNVGTGFVPIGITSSLAGPNCCRYTVYSASGFSGNFNGLGHTINGLTTSDTDTYNSLFGLPTGLFSVVNSGGIVSNVGVTNANIESFGDNAASVGAIAGKAVDTAKVLAVYSTGTVSKSSYQANNFTGGLIGAMENQAVLSYSYSTATVNGGSNAGALVGEADFSSANNSAWRVEISNNFAASTVTGSNAGLLGNASDLVTLSKNYFIGGALVGYDSGLINSGVSFVTEQDNYVNGTPAAGATGGTSKTLSQLQTLGTFGSWSIKGDSTLTTGYPFIRFDSDGIWVIGTGTSGGGSGSSSSATTTDVTTPVANALITPPAFEPPLFTPGLPPTSGSATTPPPIVVNPLPVVTAVLGSDVPLMLVPAPAPGQPTQGVTLSQALAMLGGGGAAGGDKVVRVPTSRNSMEDIVNGGLNLPDGVEQELFVIQDSGLQQ